jgi:hypothetical protein
MLEAKWKIDKEDGRGWQGVQVSNLFDKLSESANTEKLRRLLLSYLESGPKTSGEIFEFIIDNRFLPKHGTEILKSIQDRLEVTDQSGKNTPKGAYYLTYDNFKENPKRVTIKLK